MGAPATWTHEEVAAWLSSLGLESCIPNFARDAVDGKLLCELGADELVDFLGCTPLQARRIRSAVEDAGAPVLQPKAAPAAVAAPVAAVPSKPGVAPRAVVAKDVVQQDHLQRFADLNSRITALREEMPSENLAKAQAQVQGLSSTLQGQVQELSPLPEQIQREQKKVEGLTSGCCLFLVSKAPEKLEARKAALSKLQEQQAAGQRRMSELQGQLAAAQGSAAGWQGKVAEVQQLSADRQALMEVIFSAPAWAEDTTLQALKAEIADLSDKVTGQQRGFAAFRQGNDLLQEADRNLQQAMQMLSRTRFMGFVGMGRRGGPGMGGRRNGMGDIFQMQMLRQANDLIQRAANSVAAARTHLPSLPPINPDVLGAARMGVFQNFLLGGLMSDVMEVRLIRKSMEQVEELRRGVREGLQWTSSHAGAYSGGLAQLRAAVAAKQADEAKYRHTALLSALA